MKNYLSLMNRIMTEGIICKDRTGVGRQKIFGAQLRFKMADGFPMLTTNPVPFKNPVQEILWMIRGSSKNQELNDAGVNIWNTWAVKKENIEAFVKKYFSERYKSEVFEKSVIKSLGDRMLNDVGPIYGPAWRFAPVTVESALYPEIDETRIASDMLVWYKKSFEEQKKELIASIVPAEGEATPEEIEEVAWKIFLQKLYYSQIDQLQYVLYNLKHRPYSSRLLISTWIPGNLPFEELPPEENVLLGKGALAPCHVLQQYIVFPPEKEGGKLRLSLMLSQRSH
jgi:thymidylate synthase